MEGACEDGEQHSTMVEVPDRRVRCSGSACLRPGSPPHAMNWTSEVAHLKLYGYPLSIMYMYNPFVVETEGNGKVSSPRPLDTGGVAYNRPNSSTPGLASLRSTRAARRKQALGQQDAIKRDYAAWRGRPTNRTPPDGS